MNNFEKYSNLEKGRSIYFLEPHAEPEWIDTELSETSINPVQNWVIFSKFKQLEESLISPIIEWNENSNLNDYIAEGSYNLKGLRLNKDDNFPISNIGENASIAAKLVVTGTPEGTTVYRHIIG